VLWDVRFVPKADIGTAEKASFNHRGSEFKYDMPLLQFGTFNRFFRQG